ncbi:hypothetical protein [Leptospira neocaledonica]|uniref:Outer membrane protein beta-barrel domain-containing protein n=1 Tax=Leptospira neocaledonica TaxID=2023192 RepID=A0A2M9ZUG3_9LEPT|nr:hypothetical protein [Leptospira neocaledonica]PJZ75619.1 hypothetical protein CH365_17905 [Leptospira neocaledonica]
MKILKIALVFLMLVPKILLAQESDQKDRRKEKPFSIGFGLTSNANFNLETISFNYNLGENISVGLNIHRTVRMVGNKFTDNYVFICSAGSYPGVSNCEEYEHIKKMSSDVYLNYFPFGGIFFLAAHVGTLPDYNFKVSFDDTRAPSILANNSSSLSYTAERKNTIFGAAGFGVKWQSSNGVFVKFEFGFFQVVHAEDKVYVYSDDRGLLPQSRPPSLVDTVLVKETMIKEPDSLNALISLSFGCAF